jgi:serine/threonine-protein kinase
MSQPALAVGQIVSGTYRIVRRVGGGGMGEIYEAAHARLAGRYAIKILRPEVAGSDASARFQREAKVTSALQHPNVVQVVDFNTLEGGAPYLVMEFLDGPELAEVMKRSGPVPLPRVVCYAKQIASGLMAAHDKKIIHRDLKPQNIFVLTVIGHDDEVIKIVDFGISKRIEATTTVTSPSAVLGTVHYMSPEQARGRVDEIDARTDQFSFAVIVYEMLTGEDAFRGDDVSSLVYQIVHEDPPALAAPGGLIPPAVASVLKRALAKDKERRFPTVKAFATALVEAAAAGADATRVTAGAAPRTASDTTPGAASNVVDASSRRRGARRAAASTLGLAALAVAGALYARREPSHAAPAHAPAPPPIAERRGEPPPAPAPAAVEPPPFGRVAVPPDEAPPASLRDTTREARPSAAKKVTAVQSSRRSASRRSEPTAPRGAGGNCNPSFYLDAQGDKHFKKECFLNETASQ